MTKTDPTIAETSASGDTSQSDPDVLAAAAQPGLRLAQVLHTLINGYPDRPMLGYRSRTLHSDAATNRTTITLQDHFDTISRTQFWSRVSAVAAALNAAPEPLRPGDFVATIGFASPDYLVIDTVCAYLGLVAVPLQHNAATATLEPILAETSPRMIAVSADYIDVALETASYAEQLRHLVVFDYQPALPQHRNAFARAEQQMASRRVDVRSIDAVALTGTALPPAALYTGGDEDRLAMVMYTSGSTGTPKGAMFTEAMLCRIWTTPFLRDTDLSAVNLNFMPLNHLGGRIPLVSAIQSGGISYFVAEPDLSTLFDDYALVRPTELGLVPRVVDMLYQHFSGTVSRLQGGGLDADAAVREATIELRDRILGGRVQSSFVVTAPLAPELATFLENVLGVHVSNGYGLTELGPVATDGVLNRPPVTDYKLVDVPELGYFTTDSPHPRGELLIKSHIMFPGYYRRPEATAEAFAADGYYRTGDVMAEIGPDHLVYVDRRNNVLKLAQGEFVAVANLEAVYVGAPGIRQIFVYGNSERASLLAVIVPTDEALDQHGHGDALYAALTTALQETARSAHLQSYETPVAFLIEPVPFSTANGLLSGVGKLLRPKLKARYGQDLEQLYTDIATAQADAINTLGKSASHRPTIDTVMDAAAAIVGSTVADPEAHFVDLGGDSLSALTLSNMLHDFFGVEVPVGAIVNPAADLAALARTIDDARTSTSTRPTVTSVHGDDLGEIRATELTLDKFIDQDTLDRAPQLSVPDGTPKVILITGANGWLGHFLTLDWLEKAAAVGGTVIALVRGRDTEQARHRLAQSYSSDPELAGRFGELAAGHLQVLAADIGEPDLGLDTATWVRLAQEVDQIVHPAALVNHVLPYRQLFVPNVVGTAELIRLAMTHHIKPITYLSTVAVAMTVTARAFAEDGDIREVSPARSVDDGYANGYANSKWAGEVLLRQAHDLCALPVTVFRSDLILAHSKYRGQVNLPDMFTRLIFSLLITGLAPGSFYQPDPAGGRARAHYDGLPVDFVSGAITSISAAHRRGFTSYDTMNPHDDGVSLDVFVDWLIEAGHRITRVDDYTLWLSRFETALRQLPDTQRQQSVLPLLHAYAHPEQPVPGALAPTAVFQAAVRTNGVGAHHDIPHLTKELIHKYVEDLNAAGLL